MAVQVSAAQQQLDGLSITCSAVRVAGAFMCDFSGVQQQLQELQRDIAAVWHDPCHLCVLTKLQAAHQQQQRMAAAVKVRCVLGLVCSTLASSCAWTCADISALPEGVQHETPRQPCAACLVSLQVLWTDFVQAAAMRLPLRAMSACALTAYCGDYCVHMA